MLILLFVFLFSCFSVAAIIYYIFSLILKDIRVRIILNERKRKIKKYSKTYWQIKKIVL